MKVENVTTYGNVRYGSSYKFTEVNGSNYGVTLYLQDDATNCKLSYIHGAGILYNVSDQIKKQIIDELLKHSKGSVILNTTQKIVTDFIEKNYETYYYHSVPVGYGNAFQYHICFRNNIVINTSCRKPMIEATTNSEITKDKVKVKLMEVLKMRKRKVDYVEEFINLL
jgi:hypothetical protein